MKSVMGTVLVCGLAILALSVVAVASASAALPEFKPVPTKKKFTATSGAVRLNDPGYREVIECTKSSTTGEITGARTVGHVVEVLTGCTGYTGSGSRCPVSSTGAKAEEIVTKPLEGELGTVAKAEASSGVGLRLRQEATSKKWFTQTGPPCISESSVSGSLVGEIGVPESKSVKHELAFDVSSEKQAIREIKLDSGTLEKPELVYGASVDTLESKFSLTFEEAVEI